MKLKNFAQLLLALSLTFVACTEADNSTQQQQPSEDPIVKVEAKDFVGEYRGDAYTQRAGAYTLILTADGFVEYSGGMMPNSTYYLLDGFGDFYEGKNTGYVTLPEGTYTLDTTNSLAKGTISHAHSSYITTDDDAMGTAYPFESAELVVTVEGATLNAVIEGKKHIVTFEGQATVADKRAEDREFSAPNAWCFFYGDHDSKDVADSYLLFLSDDTEYNQSSNKIYYRLDLFSEIVDKSNGFAIPYGTYIVDEESSRQPFTVAVGQYSDFLSGPTKEIGAVTAGRVVVDENGITAELHIMGGVHTVTYKGYIPVSDFSDSYFE